MEYVYAALLLHSAGKEIKEESVTAVLTSAGVNVEAVRVKALISALEGVNIGEAIAKAAFAAPAAAAPSAAAAPASSGAAPAADTASKEKESEKAEESGMEGLSALFG